MAEAQSLEGIYQTYKDDGLMTISAWSEDAQRVLPTTEQLSSWANQYGITSPVVADPNSALYWRFGTGGLPASILLGPGAEVLKIGHITAADIEAALP
ncbi:MAG: hypothetical protein VXW32_00460 [Myxococcota bacterium]|nr:hypothetical protein [Myxococcota bacterium]